MDRGTLAQEFRVDADAELGAGALAGAGLKRRNHQLAHRAGQHSATDHHDRCAVMPLEARPDLLADTADVLQVDAAVRHAGRAHADEQEVRGPYRRGHVGRRAQAPRRDLLLDDFADLLFDDGCPAGVDEIDLPRLGIDADDFVAIPGQTARGDGPYVSET